MKDLTYHDDTNPGPLGPPIRPTAAPAEPKRIAPGVLEGEDGRMYTDTPEPPAAGWPWWCLPGLKP